MSHATATKARAPRAVTSRTTARNDNRPARAASAGGTGGPPRPGIRRPPLPMAAMLEAVRWGFATARASVADFPEEAEAIDRVATAAELAITGAAPDAIARVDEIDVLTTLSILLTSIDWPDGREVAELAGLGLDRMTHGACCRRAPAAIAMPARGRRAPLTVRHLRLVP